MMSVIFSTLWNAAKITIPIPVVLLLAFGLWTKLDKASFARKSVDAAVTNLVAEAEIKAAQARVDAMAKILAASNKAASEAAAKLADGVEATRQFELRTQTLETINADLTKELTDLLDKPVSPSCTVGADLFKRLRNK